MLKKKLIKSKIRKDKKRIAVIVEDGAMAFQDLHSLTNGRGKSYYQEKKSDIREEFNSGSSTSKCMANSGNCIYGIEIIGKNPPNLQDHLQSYHHGKTRYPWERMQ